MGYTLKTNKYRYTSWLRFKPEMKVPDWNNSIAEELYDHGDDEGETRNLATSQTHAGIKNELKIMLQRGWRNALPFTG